MSSVSRTILNRRRLGLILSAMLLCAWTSRADAQVSGFGGSGGGDPTHNISASARILPAAAGEMPRLSITAEMADGWHIFSLTQQPGGPKRTKIEIAPSDQFKLAGPLKPAPAPEVKHYNDIWPDLPVEEHQPRVTWTAPLALSPGVDPGKLVIRIRLVAQLCSDRCVDVTLPLTARLEGAAATGRPDAIPPNYVSPEIGGLPAAPLQTPPRVRAPLNNSPPAAAAGELLKSKYLTLSGQFDRETVPPGSRANLTFTAVPAKGYHIYALADREPKDPQQSRPTLIVVNERSGLKVGPPTADAAPIEKKPDEERVDHYYTNPVRWTLPIEVPANTAPGDHTISGLIGFMTCSGDLCDPPKGARFSVNVKVSPEDRPGATPVQFTRTTYREVADAAAQQPASDGAMAVASVAGSGKAILLTELITNLALAFLGGLLLNAMPCVLPVIGLKVMSLVQQAHDDRRRILMLNLWFAFGVCAVFLTAAALIASAAAGGAAFFQRPLFRIVMAAVTFVFALSLLGVWEIPVPGWVGSQSVNLLGEREGPAGALAKGVFSTLLATPCIGPLMGGTLEWTLGLGSTTLIFAIYGMMGLGMASPYLVIGLQPKLIRFVPRPGPWMETFKQLMGFVLLATVVWLFWIMPPRFVVPTIGLLFALWLGCWWIGRTPLTAELDKKLTAWTTAAAMALGLGFVSFYLLTDSNNPAVNGGQVAPSAEMLTTTERDTGRVWWPFSAPLLAELKQKRVPVLVDFTARWCFTCQVNKKIALHTKATESFMQENGIVGLVADKTEDAPEIDRLMASLGHKSLMIPYYVVFPADGGQPIPYDSGPILQGTLLDMLKKAGRSPESVAINKVLWQPYTPALLEKLQRQERTVLVHFSARWDCTTQIEKKIALRTAATEKFMQDNGVVGLVADKTEDAPDVDRLLVQLGNASQSIPFFAVFPGDGRPAITFRDGLLTQAALLDLLKQAGPSVARSAEKTATKPL